MSEIELDTCMWRTGRRVGRTIYAQLGAEPDDSDPLIGVMDTVRCAFAAVRAHNEEQRRMRGAYGRPPR